MTSVWLFMMRKNRGNHSCTIFAQSSGYFVKNCSRSENWIFLKGKLGSLCRMVRAAKGLIFRLCMCWCVIVNKSTWRAFSTEELSWICNNVPNKYIYFLSLNEPEFILFSYQVITCYVTCLHTLNPAFNYKFFCLFIFFILLLLHDSKYKGIR
jgi:hypothetical protein